MAELTSGMLSALALTCGAWGLVFVVMVLAMRAVDLTDEFVDWIGDADVQVWYDRVRGLWR